MRQMTCSWTTEKEVTGEKHKSKILYKYLNNTRILKTVVSNMEEFGKALVKPS